MEDISKKKKENIKQDVAQEQLQQEQSPEELKRTIKKLERELKREKRAVKSADALEKELIAQRKELDEVLDSHLAYMITDNNLKITEASKAVTQLLGYSKNEVLGKSATKFIRYEDVEKFTHGCEYVSSHGKEAWGTELSMIDTNLIDITTRIFIYPSFSAGKLDGFIIIIKDITNDILLHQLRRKLAQSQKNNDTMLDFLTSTTAAVLNTISYKISAVIKIIVIFIVLFLIYATNFEIDELVRGNGKIIPVSKVKHLKHLEGGIVTDIFVKEGDNVKKGQILVKLDPVAYKSKYNENRARIMLLKAKIERLKAEFNNKKIDEIKCDGECNKQIIRDELSLYHSDVAKLQQTISKQLEQIKTQESVLKDAKSKYKISKENYLSLKEEYNVKKSLVKQKVFYVYEIRNLKRELNKIESEMKSAKETIAQTQSKIQEIRNTIEETKMSFRNKAAQEHNDVLNELSRLQENQKSLLDIISRTSIKSPIDGTVNELFIHTIGSSIPPGSEVLSIVPNSRELVAEARVLPADIGKIHIGQDAELKVTAFDYAIYGDLKGKIINISPDTIFAEDRKEYFLVYVKTKRNYLDNNEKYKVKVGMKANVNIIVGKKTIMSYLLKPILKSVQKD